MASFQPEKIGYMCRNWLGVVNVCFSQKRTFRSSEILDSDFRFRPKPAVQFSGPIQTVRPRYGTCARHTFLRNSKIESKSRAPCVIAD